MRSLKHFAMFAALLLTLGLGGYTAQARDPGDAWPWGSEMPFPWRGIKGTWLAKAPGVSTYFTFKKVMVADGINQLQVKQFDAKSCRLLSNGVGYEEDRVVKAVLMSRNNAFELTVHVFRTADLKNMVGRRLIERAMDSKTATVMSMTSLSNLDEQMTVELEKIDVDPAGICK